MTADIAIRASRQWIALKSDLVASTLSEVRLHLAEAMQGRCNVVLDLSSVGDMDAAGAALICHLNRELGRQSRGLVLVGVHGRVRGMFADLALDTIIPVNPPAIPQ